MVKEGYKEVRVGPKTKLIPEEWKVKKLKKVIKKRKGKRPNKLFDSKNGENSIPYLSVNYLRGNDFPEWCSKNDDNKVEVKENEILMIWDGSYSGNVFMGFNGALSSTMARLKCEDDINNQYLFYQLRNNFKIFQSTTIGTSVPHVAGKIFENLNIPTPPKREQKIIASILSSVDKSIEKTDKVIEETKELKKGLMQELLTKGIGHSEFKEVRVGTKKTKIPQRWNIYNLEELVDLRNGKFNPTKNLSDNFDIPVYGGNGITGYYNEPLIEEPTIVIGRVGEYCGSIHLVKEKTWVTDNAIYINEINDKNNIYLDYLALYLKFANLNNLSNRTGQPKLTQSRILTVGIPVPPLEEQKKIASILSSVDAKIQKEEEYKSKLEQLKKGLMQKLLTGEIRVNTDMEV